MVKQTGGFIYADSIIGTGTTFSLYFPSFDEASTAAARGRALAEAKSAQAQLLEPEDYLAGGGVILLVEDEAPARVFASRALRLSGKTVLEAENGEQAVGMLADPELKVDVFVTDVIMQGMDGPTWLREALKQRPKVRVILVSGYAEDSFSHTQARIPNSVFLPKPFSLSELTSTVQGLVH